METLHLCPLCGDSAPRKSTPIADHSVTHELFHIEDCSSCGFRFTNPRPAGDTLARYYNSSTYASHSNGSDGVSGLLYRIARSVALHGKYRLVKGLQPHGRALDIGCGTGEFLAFLMSRAYAVQGVEPSPHARERAIAKYSIDVVPSIDSLLISEQFQVITLWHVLEHLPSPLDIFKKLFGLLSKGGLLVIAVPNRQSWDAQYYGVDWAAWDVPRHLSHFRQEDILKLFRDHGFELIEVRRMWLDAFYVSMLSEQYRGRGKLISLIKGILVGGWSNLVSLLTRRPTSSSMFIARKHGG